MAVSITAAQIRKIAPTALPSIVQALVSDQASLAAAGITTSPLRVIHFLSQMHHESGGFRRLIENLNYTAPRLLQVWPKRFGPPPKTDPNPYAGRPEKLANFVYGGRLGNSQPGDGWRYRGRGIVQLTGRANYRDATEWVRQSFPDAPDFEVNPSPAGTAEWAVKIAAAFWVDKGCSALADRDDVEGVTRKINGKLNGLADRKVQLAKCRQVWIP